MKWGGLGPRPRSSAEEVARPGGWEAPPQTSWEPRPNPLPELFLSFPIQEREVVSRFYPLNLTDICRALLWVPCGYPPPRLSVPTVQASEGTQPSAHGCPGRGRCCEGTEPGSSVLWAAECGPGRVRSQDGTLGSLASVTKQWEPLLAWTPASHLGARPGSQHVHSQRTQPGPGPASWGGDDSCAPAALSQGATCPSAQPADRCGPGAVCVCVWGGAGGGVTPR